MSPQAPDGLPRRIVDLAVRPLPAPHRDRYRREFTADLHHLPRQAQMRYAAQVLLRSFSLRAALDRSAPASIGERVMSKPPAPPLGCRLRLWHHWQTHHTEDGGRYVACATCHKEMAPATLGTMQGTIPWGILDRR